MTPQELLSKQIVIGRRVESASSVKTHKQCPRKYYYSYVETLPTKPSIHLVRGSVVHEVLENVYDGDWSNVTWDSCEQELTIRSQKSLIEKWRNSLPIFARVGLDQEELITYFEETLRMLTEWARKQATFLKHYQSLGTFPDVFATLTPIREEEYVSQRYGLRGYVDALQTLPNGKKRIIDYKTNKRIDLADHELQLSMYALLYHEKNGTLPDEVGVHFLREGEQTIKTSQEHLINAIQALEDIHARTTSNEKTDYNKNVTRLCDYCDYRKMCFHGQTTDEYKKEFDVPLSLSEEKV